MDMFTAIADPTRRTIIELLAARGELSATEISTKFKMSAPAISQHLKVLREAKLVQVEKRAQMRMYKVNPLAMHEIEAWAKKMSKVRHDRFERIESVLESLKIKK